MGKGQIFSLDLLISLVAVTVAVGLILQTIEVNTYYQKADRPAKELKAVAETTASLLMASNETTCLDSTGEHIMNCIDETADFSAIFPKDYDYEIKINGTTISESGDVKEKDFYEIQRKSTQGEIVSVKVWKK